MGQHRFSSKTILDSSALGYSDENYIKGPMRLIIAAYVLLAVAASARSLFQIITKFDNAKISYSLSLLAAFIYLLTSLCLYYSDNQIIRKLSFVILIIEFLAVAAVGVLSLVFPEFFSSALGDEINSVWSYFGIGYGFVPLILPILAFIALKYSKKG